MKVVRPRFTPRSLALAIAAAGLATGASAPSFAKESRAMLEEIIVTARKVEESMQDVAIAVSAFSGEGLPNSRLFPVIF